jgi:hypothetical protein
VIQHDLQLVYIFGLLQCVFSTKGLLFTYSRKWGSPDFRKTTLSGLDGLINMLYCQFLLTNAREGDCKAKKLFDVHHQIALRARVFITTRNQWQLHEHKFASQAKRSPQH